jgi:glycosyltransferase involved in cell wall biosynthesis
MKSAYNETGLYYTGTPRIGLSDGGWRMRVLFLATFPVEAACTRYRCQQYFPYLEAQGIHCVLRPFLSPALFRRLYQPGRIPAQAAGMLAALAGRLRDILQAGRYDVLFVQREAALFGPPFFEWLLSREIRGRLVFDFDDAVFVPYTSPTYGRWATWLKCAWKTKTILRLSRHVIAGNLFLSEYARRHNANVSIIPTVVDPDQYSYTTRKPDRIPIIGWIGSPTTTKYLKPLIPVLERLGAEEKFELRIIGANEPFHIATVRTVNEPWRLETEISDFQKLDIGLYPVIEDTWSLGKCGFKAIQYMASGAACIASPVGVNSRIIEDGINGMLAATPEEWHRKLTLLVRSADLRRQLAVKAREKVEAFYSLKNHAPILANILESVAGRGSD